jgi:hypothetical protein
MLIPGGLAEAADFPQCPSLEAWDVIQMVEQMCNLGVCPASQSKDWDHDPGGVKPKGQNCQQL